jgi:flagellin-like protein
MFNINQRSISPLIATILLIVIAVILVVAILTWGKDFLSESLEETKYYLKEANSLSGMITTQSTFNNFISIINNHPQETITVVGYRIVPSTNNQHFHLLNTNYYLEEKITISSRQTSTIRLHCVPESSFGVDLLLSDNTFVRANASVRNYSSSMCDIYDKLILAYDMKTIEGDTLIDVSGNGFDGVIPSGISIIEDGLTDNDGVHKGILLYSSPIINTLDYTIIARIKLNSSSNDDRVIFGNGNSTSDLIIDSLGVSNRKLSWNYNSTGSYKEGGTQVLDVGVWHTIAFVSSGGRTGDIKIYVNGVEDIVTTTNFYRSGSTSRLFDRDHGTSNPFLGSINDFKIYERALSEQEIKNYHNYFEKRISLREDFSGEDVGENVGPTGWIKTGGTFNIGEINIEKGNLISGMSIENFTLVGNGSNLFKIETGIKQTGKRYRYTFDVLNDVSSLVKVQHTTKTSDDRTLDDFGNNLNVSGQKQLTFSTSDASGAGSNVQLGWMPSVAGETYTVSNLVFEEINPLPTISTNTKYLKRISLGQIGVKSNQAYGTWEFDVFTAGSNLNTIGIISNEIGSLGNFKGYAVVLNYTVKTLTLRRSDGDESNTVLISSGADYLENNTWYKIKVTRNINNKFNLYIKGGIYDFDEWTFVGSATNDVYDESNYFLTDMTINSKIANLLFIKGIPVD